MHASFLQLSTAIWKRDRDLSGAGRRRVYFPGSIGLFGWKSTWPEWNENTTHDVNANRRAGPILAWHRIF